MGLPAQNDWNPFHLSLPLWTEESMGRSDGGTGDMKLRESSLGSGKGKSYSFFALVSLEQVEGDTEGNEGKDSITDRLV